MVTVSFMTSSHCLYSDALVAIKRRKIFGLFQKKKKKIKINLFLAFFYHNFYSHCIKELHYIQSVNII